MDAFGEKYSLVWEDFQQNASRSFAELWEDKNFCDVTLVCNDNQQVVVHKAVLVSSSSLLSSVLRSNSHPHPLIFLWGVQFEQLKAVLDFCYRGQVTVPKWEIEEFLRVAKLLGVKGTGGVDSSEVDKELNQAIDLSKPIENNEIKDTISEDNFGDTFVEIRNPLLSVSPEEEQKDGSSSLNPIYHYFTVNTDNKTIASCNKCGKNVERRFTTIRKEPRFSIRFMKHHLRKHQKEFDQFTATQNSLILEARIQKKNEDIGEKEENTETTTFCIESMPSEQASSERLSLIEQISEERNKQSIRKQATDKNAKEMKVEKSLEDETNLYVKENLIIQETKHACDYPNSGFVPSRSFNLGRHKAQQHEKRSIPLLCSRSFCTETFDTKQELQEHRDTCIIKCSWKQCGKEFTRGDHFQSHTKVHPQDGKGKEDEFLFVPPKALSAPLNLEDVEIRLKRIWNKMKPSVNFV